jgi:hypothetical protein
MAEGPEVFGGLNKTGVIVFVVCLFVCLPLCWIPWVVESMKADKSSTPPQA